MKRKRNNAPVKNPIKPQHGKSLLEKFPELCREWDYEKNYPLTPSDLSYGTTYAVYWICPLGHSYLMGPNNRTNKIRKQGCPYCSIGGNRVWEGNCLATLNPKLALEWHPTKNGVLTPKNVTASSVKNVWWLCPNCGNEWMGIIELRNRGGLSCPVCNKLDYVFPEIAKEWHPTRNKPLKPSDVSCASGKRVCWECQICGKLWYTAVNHRTNKKNGTGCPFCAKEIILKNGLHMDSYIEAFYYLKLTGDGVKFIYNMEYGGKMGNRRYDFYIPKDNLYIEVTSYKEGSIRWENYSRNIRKKRNYVCNVLGAKFLFIKRRLTASELSFVRTNMMAKNK